MSDIQSPPPSWYEPPTERWGRCPDCGANQEDSEYHPDDTWEGMYYCDCGRHYTNDEAFSDPDEEEPADLDEWMERNGY